MEILILLAILVAAYLMVLAKRMPALIRSFRYQSFFLFLATLLSAFKEKQLDLYLVCGLVLVLKVVIIPYFLLRTIKRIKVNDNLGLFINAQLSLICALLFTYFSWVFSKLIVPDQLSSSGIALTISFSIIFIGIFIMVARMKALSQIIGLLIMENGIFLLASSVLGGMPFFVEIAIFFDVFVSVVISGIFVYRINKLFTHIDAHKLSGLKG